MELNNKAFDSLEPERKNFIMNIIADINNGRLSTPMQIMNRFADMPKGREFSSAERQAMFGAVIASMDGEQRERLLEILKIAKNV